MTAGRLIVGTMSYNAHVQNMARALHEAKLLDRYVTAGVDVWDKGFALALKRRISRLFPRIEAELNRRPTSGIPVERIETRWPVEISRVFANRVGWVQTGDWLWERGEWSLDRRCARLLETPGIGGFLGVEHGALAALKAARRLGKIGGLAFLSPHHRTRARWIDAEYTKFPELRTEVQARLRKLADRRDRRRDEEAQTADWIITNSSFTTRSLIAAGVSERKLLTVPLGGPDPISASELRQDTPRNMTFLFAGSLSVTKGGHYLLRAWRHLASRSNELHIYGSVALPRPVVSEALSAPGGDQIVFHGSVEPAVLSAAYRRANVLVLPTLCDGFGMVVSEALAHGLPVVTTTNAGAADLIVHGRTGFVIPAADENALTSSLTWCADHPAELSEMRRAALTAAASWTWTGYRTRFLRALTPMLARSSVTPAAVRVEPISVATL